MSNIARCRGSGLTHLMKVDPALARCLKLGTRTNQFMVVSEQAFPLPRANSSRVLRHRALYGAPAMIETVLK